MAGRKPSKTAFTVHNVDWSLPTGGLGHLGWTDDSVRKRQQVIATNNRPGNRGASPERATTSCDHIGQPGRLVGMDSRSGQPPPVTKTDDQD